MGTSFPTVPVDNIGPSVPNVPWSVGGRRFLPKASSYWADVSTSVDERCVGGSELDERPQQEKHDARE